MRNKKRELLDKLESEGEEQVRLNLAADHYGVRNKKYVEAWLRNKEIEREKAQQKKIHSQTKEKIKESRKQTKAMKISAGGAILAVLVSIGALIFSIRALHISERENLDIGLRKYIGDYQALLLSNARNNTLFAFLDCIISNNSSSYCLRNYFHIFRQGIKIPFKNITG